MHGVKHAVLRAIVEFAYCGETSVHEEHLHELVAVAGLLEMRGLRAVLPHKLGVTCDESAITQVRPPAFFRRGERVRTSCSDPSSGRGSVSVSAVTVDEAHVALAKEEAASRFALQMLQKDLTSNLFVIEDACTEATVETSLAPRVEDEPPPPMTLKQLVADAVSADPGYGDQPPYASFIIDERGATPGGELAKRRRGRPRKVKLETTAADGTALAALLAEEVPQGQQEVVPEDGSPPLRKRCTRASLRCEPQTQQHQPQIMLE